MKMMTVVKWGGLVMLAVGVVANAQDPAKGTGQPVGELGGGEKGKLEGQHPRPTPEQMAKHLMEKFDANKDGELSQAELTLALEVMREHRPRGAGGKGDTTTGGATETHPAPPSADKVAMHMIEKFSSDKKGLTETEFVKAIEAHRANRGQHAASGQRPGAKPAGTEVGQ
jgi:hypothetical protein